MRADRDDERVEGQHLAALERHDAAGGLHGRDAAADERGAGAVDDVGEAQVDAGARARRRAPVAVPGDA